MRKLIACIKLKIVKKLPYLNINTQYILSIFDWLTFFWFIDDLSLFLSLIFIRSMFCSVDDLIKNHLIQLLKTHQFLEFYRKNKVSLSILIL